MTHYCAAEDFNHHYAFSTKETNMSLVLILVVCFEEINVWTLSQQSPVSKGLRVHHNR